MHLAAESQVDRSIKNPSDFIETNVVGTFNMLEISLDYWKRSNKHKSFIFHHISSDEVFGSLSFDSTDLFNEAGYMEFKNFITNSFVRPFWFTCRNDDVETKPRWI